MELVEKVAIVTGSSRGIGYGIASALSRVGAKVIISGREEETCRSAVETITQDGGSSIYVTIDIARSGEVERLVEAALEAFGKVDILVNNVATNPYEGPVIGVPLPDWQRTLSVNLTAPLLLAQTCWNAWMKHAGGNIVNVASVGAHRPAHPTMGVYDISKSALVHLTTQLAAELAPSVRVNAVAPGLIKTEFSRSAWEDGQGEIIATGYPMQRLGEPSDVADAVVYLVGKGAGWVTGQTITVNGGGLDPFDWETRPGHYR
jgi:NAD(P)-dependent dehydrogenase (short-subunit alcohol dehydrogenase family)|tara:strand:- start:465 stop:1247 length:783 start_codon:yes stop_codon:yes gene_type:complete